MKYTETTLIGATGVQTTPIHDGRPDDVVAGHKRRAVTLWILLIFGSLAYAAWMVAAAVEKRNNPSTSFVLSNTIYAYPDIWVCLYDTYGCDEQELEEECLNSSSMTEGRNASAVFYPGGELEQEIAAVGKLTDSKGWCLEFKASEVTALQGQERDGIIYKDYVDLNMSWYPGGSAGASTTCLPEGEKWVPHREWVTVFLHDPATGKTSTGAQISYSCITSESNSHVFTYMGIGLNEQHNIKKDDVVSYKALSVTSSVFKEEANEGISDPYAYLEMQIQQEPDSWEVVTEIDPLDVGEMLGSIGGFWDLILILWPIFFVAATRDDPHLKARNFKKSAETAAERAGITGGMVSIRGPFKRTTGFGDHTSAGKIDFTESGTEGEHPHWETTPPDTNPPAEHLDV